MLLSPINAIKWGSHQRMWPKEEVIKGCLYVKFKGLLDVKRCHLRDAKGHESLKRGYNDHSPREHQL